MPHLDTPSTASPSPQRRPRRIKRAALTLALAGGVVAGGAGLAYAAGNAPSPTSSFATSSGSQGQAGVRGHARQGGTASAGPKAKPDGPHAAGSSTSAAGIDGKVTAVSGTTLTVTSDLGQSRSYALSSSTTIHQGPKQKLSLSNLKVGDHVRVRADDSASSGSTPKATDVDVHLAHIDGVVASVSGSTVTVTDRDGFTRRIDVSGAVSSSVRSGAPVHAVGRVDADGTTLDATTITTRTAPADGGPGSGGPGKGGKAMKARGDRPAPSAPASGNQGKAPQQSPTTGPSSTATTPANGS